jgi:hypothetical protein
MLPAESLRRWRILAAGMENCSQRKDMEPPVWSEAYSSSSKRFFFKTYEKLLPGRNPCVQIPCEFFFSFLIVVIVSFLFLTKFFILSSL